MKHQTSTSQRRKSSSSEEDNDTSSTALYSESQTELYIPPPVINSIIPKNTYGNIDIYVPSMVPAGAAHIIRPSISLAAKFAGIDYADAVTGFDFVRNKASARVNGIVVAEENIEGLLEVWEGMMERVRGEEERRRVQGVMERWRRFLIGMGIRRRLEETHGKLGEENVAADEDDGSEREGGGFLPGSSRDGKDLGGGDFRALEITTNMGSTNLFHRSLLRDHALEKNSDVGRNGGIHDGGQDGSLNVPDQEMNDYLDGEFARDEDVQMDDEAEDEGGEEDKESEGGGFVQDNSDSEGGGFIYDDEDGIL